MGIELRRFSTKIPMKKLETFLIQYDIGAFALLLLIPLIMFATANKDGSFWLSEEPRNMLNGAFVLDLFKDFPLHDPVAWAHQYYAQYPSLTILFYPPLFFAFLALGYAIFGVSHATAIGVLAVFGFALAAGIYALGKRLMHPLAAFSLAILFSFAPETLLWNCHLMLDMPMLAWMVWAMWNLLKYNDTSSPKYLYWTAFCSTCGLYTKQTGFYFIIAFGIFLLCTQGFSLLRRKHVWTTLVVSFVVLIPLVFLQLRFGSFNRISIVDRLDIGIPVWTWESLSWYLSLLQYTVGKATVICAAGYCILTLCRFIYSHFKQSGSLPNIKRIRIANPDLLLYATYFILGYCFLSIISLKETRHGLPIYFPVTLAAILFCCRLWPKYGHYLAFALALWVASQNMIHTVNPFVSGYNKAAHFVAQRADPQARILFHGMRDGTFVANIRGYVQRSDLTVIRADKLFLRVSVILELGASVKKEVTPQEISDMLCRYGISWAVVAVENNWDNIPVMQNLLHALRAKPFVEVTRIPIISNIFCPDSMLIVYRNCAALERPFENYDLEIPMIQYHIQPGSSK